MSTYLQVSVMAQAAVVLMAVVQFAYPSGNEHKNWEKVRSFSENTTNTALQLLPVVTALIIPKARPLPFAMAGAAIWLSGIGIGAIADDAKAEDGDRPSKATKSFGDSLVTLGSSTMVAALVAYMKTMRMA